MFVVEPDYFTDIAILKCFLKRVLFKICLHCLECEHSLSILVIGTTMIVDSLPLKAFYMVHTYRAKEEK